MPATAPASISTTVQPVGRAVNVKCPTLMPGTSVKPLDTDSDITMANEEMSWISARDLRLVGPLQFALARRRYPATLARAAGADSEGCRLSQAESARSRQQRRRTML